MDLRVLCALMGLEGAVRTGVKTEQTDEVRLKALAFYAEEKGPEEAERLVELIHRERNAVVPDCAACLNPCGNTSDFPAEDMARNFTEHPQLADLLRKAGALANSLLGNGAKEFPPVLEEVPDCAAWQPAEDRILTIEKQMMEASL